MGRRAVITGMTGAAAAALLPSPTRLAFAQQRRPLTPRQTEGPFYPADWTGDIDADLVVVKGEATRALGQIAHVRGRILDVNGNPVEGARVEIWQCDNQGVYRHPRDERGTRRKDAGFQGRGRALTASDGQYTFRTIKPVAYPGRTPHIHFKVDHPGGSQLITQLYVHGESQNNRDGILNGIRDPRQRDSVIVKFEPAERLEQGALAATFDIVLAA
jgi:protocatechuate 3,4-dioxygenase beta subunit